MTNGKRTGQHNRLRSSRYRARSFTGLLLALVWSVVMGWGLVQVMQATPATIAQLVPASPTISDPLAPLPRPSPPPTPASPVKPTLPGVDPVPQSYQLGQELYLSTCSACHLAIPPEVLPISTWRQLLLQPQHYGVTLKLPIDPPRVLIWNYLQNFSRPLLEGEEVPLRLDKSRYFTALHPDVDLKRPIKLDSCIGCHPGANQFKFR